MPITNYYYYYYYSIARADQRGQKGFQDFYVLKSLYKNFVKFVVGRLTSQDTCTSTAQHRTETRIHKADENRKHLCSFQVVQHSLTAVIRGSYRKS